MNYFKKTVLDEYNNTIIIHKKDAFASMRNAGKLASNVLDFIEPYVKEGTTTEQLDKICHDFIVKNNAIPAPLNYKGFPKINMYLNQSRSLSWYTWP